MQHLKRESEKNSVIDKSLNQGIPQSDFKTSMLGLALGKSFKSMTQAESTKVPTKLPSFNLQSPLNVSGTKDAAANTSKLSFGEQLRILKLEKQQAEGTVTPTQ